jgi:hypothetical protein
MSDEPADLTPFSQALARVAPHPGQLDRDALLFAAGRAAGRRGRLWPALSAALALTCAGLGAVVLFRPPQTVEVVRVVYLPAPQPAPAPAEQPSPLPETPALSSEWIEGMRLRNRVLQGDVTTPPQPAWHVPAVPRKQDDLPDLSSLRLNPPASTGVAPR